MSSLLAKAHRLHGEGRLPEAEALFRKILGQTPGQVEALHGLAIIRLQLGHADNARLLLEEAVRLLPQEPLLHEHLGLCLLSLDRPREAIPPLEKALSLAPTRGSPLLHLASARERLGQVDPAVAALRRLVALDPGSAEGWNNLGNLEKALGRLPEAEEALLHALDLLPDSPVIRVNLGNVAMAREQPEKARALFQQALDLQPDLAEGWNNLGDACLRLGDPAHAETAFRRAVACKPGFHVAWNNLGRLLANSNLSEEALSCFKQALALQPGHPETLNNLGKFLLDQKRPQEAEKLLQTALKARPHFAEALINLLFVKKALGETTEAMALGERAFALQPGDPTTLNLLVGLCQELCAWEKMEPLLPRLLATIRQGALIPSDSLFSIPSTPEDQLAAARRLSETLFAPAARGAPPLPCQGETGGKIRIGYLSADFHAHATSFLLVETLELHDRKRFDIFAYSYGPDDGSPMRARVQAACDRFTEIGPLSHREAAARIHADGIAILVDLKGYTSHSRSHIAAFRPAPVQVNWLGFPGTMGAAFMDYLIADPVLIPPGAESFYAEKIARLPHTYQPNDRQRAIAPPFSRQDEGLPEEGRILAAFNQIYKVTQELFDVWTGLLAAFPDCTLWMLAGHPDAMETLRQRLVRHGVAPHRLVFARPRPLAQHLSRLRLADLFLDTAPCSGHTTVSDALWAGVPVVTWPGETFASRVGGSLVTAIGLADPGVASSLADYRQKIVRLLAEPASLRSMRAQLAQNRATHPLFDTPRFVRNLERAYEIMWQRHVTGVSPENFDVLENPPA